MAGKQTRASARKKRKKRMMRLSLAAFAVVLMGAIAILLLNGAHKGAIPALAPTAAPIETAAPEATPVPQPEATPTATEAADQVTPTPTAESLPVTITISAAGDCTLGGDMLGSTEKQFYEEISQSGGIDYDYCFKNVRSIFEQDDLTIVNLEVVLTESKAYDRSDSSKVFIMRGRPSYVKMLSGSSVEIANIANNHMTDFGEAGIEELTGYLDQEDIGYCGYGRTLIKEVDGVTIGFVGINTWTTPDEDMESEITDMRAKCDVLIVSFHWGSELEYNATAKQKKYGHMAVDLGADLVLGHHPHVINGIEVYKGVNIVYSLGNFSFGGKRNPKDKDTFIYQHTFTVDNGQIVESEPNVIPCRITSAAKYNNYQPTPVTGEQANDVLKKIEYYSRKFDESLNLIGD